MKGRYTVPQQHVQTALAKSSLPLEVTSNLLTWAAVHGSLQLALRHPEFPATTRVLMGSFVEQLGAALVAAGFFTGETLQEAAELERRFHAGKITDGK